MNDAPEFIRLKRRRDEGSVDRLLIDNEKRVKRSRFLFKLTKTVASQFYDDGQQDVTPLLKHSNDDRRHFVLEQETKKRSRSDDCERQRGTQEGSVRETDGDENNDMLPPEISQLVQQHLTINESNIERSVAKLRKPSKKHYTGKAAHVVSMPSLDYVYDIYHLEQVGDDEMDTYDRQNVGFVKIVDKWADLVPDEESDPALGPSDDEDSNEEDYYQNDYPEDEDDDRSILFGSEGEEVAVDETAEQLQDIYNSNLPKSSADDDMDFKEQKEYAELFCQLGSSSNILSSLNTMNFVDLDDNNDDGAELGFEDFEDLKSESDSEKSRNIFFKSDQDDPLAAHRDRIFGKLQKMIDRR